MVELLGDLRRAHKKNEEIEGVERPAEEAGEQRVARLARSAGDIAGKAGESFCFRPSATRRAKDGIGYARDLEHFGDVVNANDVRATENACGHGGCGAPNALAFGHAAKRSPDKPLSRNADE